MEPIGLLVSRFPLDLIICSLGLVPFTFSGTATTVDFTLASDASGSPGMPLETIGINLLDGTSLYTGNSSLNPTLIG